MGLDQETVMHKQILKPSLFSGTRKTTLCGKMTFMNNNSTPDSKKVNCHHCLKKMKSPLYQKILRFQRKLKKVDTNE